MIVTKIPIKMFVLYVMRFPRRESLPAWSGDMLAAPGLPPPCKPSSGGCCSKKKNTNCRDTETATSHCFLLKPTFMNPDFDSTQPVTTVLTELVIVLPLLGVSQDFVRFRDTFELFLRLLLPSKGPREFKRHGTQHPWSFPASPAENDPTK